MAVTRSQDSQDIISNLGVSSVSIQMSLSEVAKVRPVTPKRLDKEFRCEKTIDCLLSGIEGAETQLQLPLRAGWHKTL